MKKVLAGLLLCLVAALAGAAIAWKLARTEPRLPDAPALMLRIRESARLETLDVTLYKKIDFSPDPRAPRGLWDGVAQWARYSLKPPRGKAIVFARAHLGLDLGKLDARTLRVSGRRVQVVLPQPQVSVELLPAETEVIGSDLDSAETAELFALAKSAFAREVEADLALRERANESARRTLRALFFPLGFTEVDFVDSLPQAAVQ
jgi:hypothetical protein